MIYVFDTSSFRALQHFYPAIFGTIWKQMGELVESRKILSTKEVLRELDRQDITKELEEWVRDRKSIFLEPSREETNFVSIMLSTKDFAGLLGKQPQPQVRPVADPFVIACAKRYSATVVTEEGWNHSATSLVPKPNARKIPNVCEYFKIPCINLEAFMREQGWRF